MIELRHVGIYVNDLELMENFYKKTFTMKILKSRELLGNSLVEQLLGNERKVFISKLITPYGCNTGIGDMIELVKFIDNNEIINIDRKIYIPGTAHLAFGVDNIDEICINIIDYGGSKKTEIVKVEDRKACFCVDPEGNWIELIQRGK